jgi:hypothetical protein
MKPVYRAVFVSGILALSLSACATVNRFPTPSGKPEATFPGVTKNKVVEALTNEMSGQGYKVIAAGEEKAVFSRTAGGGEYDVKKETLVSFAVTETDDGIRVVATVERVIDPGGIYETVTDISQGKEAHYISTILRDLKIK